ncbi:uncharacterized protein HMPREF1541_03944 [Cyphellophora europaea CBS 101466]|uniref:DUF2264 domain-containing protein n=1 Tax=Cyphellophora europaea (strain CBS 101466) TaxID=1220924 RepID=W2S086_CYPE1|nr:uncharacterized protein HMPREF1541_03944 [Cyphellophora europaea CBS 101466]ETN42005.1 hypothetical protein HMPREF1541_03944 [Cyphellophora europaea CBS 101466]
MSTGPPTNFTSLSTHALTTRSDFAHACSSLLQPLLPFFSPGRTRVKLGATATRYDETGAQLEGFTRPLWGLASLLAGGFPFTDASFWLEGLRNGTNPAHPEFWGWPRDLDQRMVEMCPLGFALIVAPAQLWEPLTQSEKQNVQQWLGAINAREMPNTNWLWFRVFANLAMKKNGALYDAQKLKADMDHLDGFYRGEGWSNDGPEGYTQMDYYSGSFAIQLLQLLYVKINGGEDQERAERYRDWARQYALAFVHYFDEEGRAITFGRSLTYRFAMAGFWSAVAFADLELPDPLNWGVVKGILLRNLRWWTRQLNILSPQGTLTIGYCYPNQFTSENYNSPGSPYWFMLSFAALACPESHPFWQAEEQPYPTARLPATVALRQPKHIMVRGGGHTFLLSSGQQCHYPMRAAESKYGKFAYSSVFGYSVPTGGYFVQAAGGDSMLTLSEDEGESWKVRRVAIDAAIEENEGTPVLRSGWKPWSDVSVETWLVPPEEATPNWYLRIHHINTGRNLRTSEGAWALCGERESDGRELEALGVDGREGRQQGQNEAVVVSQAGVVGIVELKAKREGVVLEEDANSNLVSSRSILPTLATTLEAGEDMWLVAAIFAVPADAHDWRETWQTMWRTRPAMPSWLERLTTQ